MTQIEDAPDPEERSVERDDDDKLQSLGSSLRVRSMRELR